MELWEDIDREIACNDIYIYIMTIYIYICVCVMYVEEIPANLRTLQVASLDVVPEDLRKMSRAVTESLAAWRGLLQANLPNGLRFRS